MSTGSRIARRYITAELLTKSWLMGIRRGWLSLLKVKPHGWSGIFKAIDSLKQFVDNLEEQWIYVRRGPTTGIPSLPEGQAALKAFTKLKEAISDQRSRAQHWMDAENQTGLMGPKPEEGAQMRQLYESAFAAQMTTYVPTRGQYQRVREANITELLDVVLKLLREDAKHLNEALEAEDAAGTSHTKDEFSEPEYTEFTLSGMKVIIDDRTVRPQQIRDYVKYLDLTHAAMKRKGFGAMWYGRIFVQCESCGGENPLGAQFGVGGEYSVRKDDIRLYMRPGKALVRLLAHELAHRYWFKHMRGSQRGRFIEWLESGAVPSVSQYGSTKPSEAFAEVVSYMVVGRDMTRDQLESMKAVLASHASELVFDDGPLEGARHGDGFGRASGM